MNKWKIERLRSNWPTFFPQHGIHRKLKILLWHWFPQCPPSPWSLRGSPWQLIYLENPFRVFLLGFITFIALFHASLPWFEHSVQVHALANSFSIPNSEWVSQSKSSWELPCLKSSHFYHYVWDKDGQYIAYIPGNIEHPVLLASSPESLLLDITLTSSKEEVSAFLQAFSSHPS